MRQTRSTTIHAVASGFTLAVLALAWPVGAQAQYVVMYPPGEGPYGPVVAAPPPLYPMPPATVPGMMQRPAATPLPGVRNATPKAIPQVDRASVAREVAQVMERTPPGTRVSLALPSGAVLHIRPSETFGGDGGTGCRNFDYTYAAIDGSTIVVSGQRCRLPDGRWFARAADTVISQTGPGGVPLAGVTTGGSADVAAGAYGTQPVYGATDTATAGQTADGAAVAATTTLPATVPLPPPRPGPAVAVAPAPGPVAPPPPAAPLPPAAAGEVPPPPAVPAPPAVAAIPAPPAPVPAPPPAAPATPTGARPVQAPANAVAVDVPASDPEVIALLQKLRYLDPAKGQWPTQDAVKTAIADFSADEGLTTPVGTDTLKARLAAAVDRLGSLARCPGASGRTTPYGVCVAAN